MEPTVSPAGSKLLLQTLRGKVPPDIQITQGAHLIQDALRHTVKVRAGVDSFS